MCYPVLFFDKNFDHKKHNWVDLINKVVDKEKDMVEVALH